MVFLMSLTYLTNHSDKDIRRYTYEVISQTIAIFCAVMIFQYMNDVTVKARLRCSVDSVWTQVSASAFQVWYAALEFHLYYMSFQGAIVLAKHKLKEVVLQQLHPLDHIEVIAAISLLLLQWQSDCTPDICSQHQHVWCSFFPMQRGAGKVAENWKTFSSLYDDRMEELCYIMWHEEAEEPEDNVLALTLSFLTVQTVRFWISGHMPDVEGTSSH
ncbi:HMA1 [Symbiodinium natans]|uniref:HMA1 protein n=1 Tax=Symbiodinium natans TaxID=878477 RepID=A0A812H4W8_9DINO|nr:HMA1 [Symbiodinium natans]